MHQVVCVQRTNSLEWNSSLSNLSIMARDSLLIDLLSHQQSRPYSIKARAVTNNNILDKSEQGLLASSHSQHLNGSDQEVLMDVL